MAKTVKISNKIKKTKEDYIISAIVFVIMLIVFISMVYPFYYCLIISFNEGRNASLGGIFFFPRKFTLDNYKQVLGDDQLLAGYKTTILRTIIGTFSSVVFTSIVAYAMSHNNLIGRKIYMGIFIFSMYFSGGLIPYYSLLRNMDLLNTFKVYIIPSLFSVWNCILMINFFQTIPESLKESAKLDGANDLVIFLRIIVPLSAPIFATIALYVGVGHWNDWYTTSFYAQQNKKIITVAYILKEIISRANITSATSTVASAGIEAVERAGTAASASYTAESLRMSTMMVVILPIICVYPFLQRFFVKGVMVGGVKG